MNVFLREIKSQKKPLALWSIFMMIMVTIGMSKYGSLTSSTVPLTEIMNSMPKLLRVISGVGSLDISTLMGYYCTLYFYLVIIASIHACLIGSNIISKEENFKTSDFLMSKPITRTLIINSKLVAAILNIIILNIVTLLSSLLSILFFTTKKETLIDLIYLMLSMFILQLIFLFLGSLIASKSRRPKKAASYSSSVLLILFIFSIIIDMKNNLEILRYITPFKYFEGSKILNSGFELKYLVLSLCIILGLYIFTLAFYNHRDLKS